MIFLTRFRFFLIIIVIFGLSINFPQSIEGQEEDNSINLLYAQVIVRDSDGNLVTYFESTRINMAKGVSVQEIIHDNSTRIISSETIEDNGITQEVIIFERNKKSADTLTTRGTTYLNEIVILEKIIATAFFSNNGYFLEPDDERTVVWTAVRAI